MYLVTAGSAVCHPASLCVIKITTLSGINKADNAGYVGKDI